LISFLRVLMFLSYRSFTCLVRVTPSSSYYLWLLWRVLFSYFLSQPVYHLYKGRLLICFELILYSATFLKLFISWRSSLVEFLWSYIYIYIYIYILSYHLQIEIPSLPLCQILSPWSPFVVLLLYLELQVLYWIDIERITAFISFGVVGLFK
jgi:hypothetical protein